MKQARWICLVLMGLTSQWVQADWPQFRGLNSSGRSAESEIVTEFGPGENELWSLETPLGHSSPIVHGSQVFLTGFDKEQRILSILGVDRMNGLVAWQRNFQPSEFEKGHPSFNPASSTPACDGEVVVAYFGSYGLVACDCAGEVLWERKMPVPKSYAGNATSPIIVGDLVYLYRANYVDHFLMAVEKRSGEVVWKVDQDEPFDAELACTACPIVVGDQLIVHSARSVQSYELLTGKRRWLAKCATTATSTPIVIGEEVIVAAWNKMGEPSLRPPFPEYGKLLRENDQNQDGLIQREELPTLWIFHRPEGVEAPQNGATVRFRFADKNGDGAISSGEWETSIQELNAYRDTYKTHGMIAIPLNSRGIVDSDNIRVLETKSIPEVPSPISDDSYLYFIKNGGVLTCLEPESGRRIYRGRTSGRGTHYASPIIAGSYLVTTSGDGILSVIELGSELKVVASNEMREAVYATPAVKDGTLYVRTHRRLFAFAKTESRP